MVNLTTLGNFQIMEMGGFSNSKLGFKYSRQAKKEVRFNYFAYLLNLLTHEKTKISK